MASHGELLYRSGDPWRDLARAVEEALTRDGAVTAVTANLTTHVIGPGWRRRVPLEGGHAMWGDFDEMPLERIVVATACGFVFNGGRGFKDLHWTTAPVLAAPGEFDWTQTETGRAFLRSHLAGEALTRVSDQGHPDKPCGAAYCVTAHHAGRW